MSENLQEGVNDQEESKKMADNLRVLADLVEKGEVVSVVCSYDDGENTHRMIRGFAPVINTMVLQLFKIVLNKA